MRRSPMRRDTPGALAWGRKKRRPLAKRSKKLADFYRDVYVPMVVEAVGGPCTVKSPACTGTCQSLHEPATRGRTGGLRAAVREGGTVPACIACNSWLSQTVEGQRWGLANGMLKGRGAA